MRVVFFTLLLANLLYMGWAEWIDVPAPPARSPIAGLPALKLISAPPPGKGAALASKTSLAPPAPPLCESVGPFDDPAIATKAADLLRAKSFAPQQRTVESPAVRRLWVYLDGFTSDAAEMRVLHRLERAGIDDAEAMPAAAGGRRVSLGLFTDPDRAEKRAKIVRAMGFKPATTERMLPGTVYWLDLTLPSGSPPIPLKDVSDLEPGGGGSSISAQPCSATPPPAAPLPQKGAPASETTTPPAPAPKAAAPTSTSSPLPDLPRCKPGGGGTVPCVASGPKTSTHPSVL